MTVPDPTQRTIIVHAGLPKTGTTSIQNTCFAHRDILLSDERVLYPDIAPNHTDTMVSAFLDDPGTHISNRMAGVNADDQKAAVRAQAVSRLEQALDRDGWQTCLISAEGLSNLSASELSRANEFLRRYAARLRVIYFVREPIAYVTSVIQQMLKGGDTLTELFQAPPLPNFTGRIGNAIKAFGRDVVEVHDFHAAVAAPDGLVGYFAGVLGWSDATRAALAARATRDNESLSYEGAYLLSRFNQVNPVFRNGQRSPRRTGRELRAASQIEGNKFVVPLRVGRDVYAATRPDVAWLNKTFGTDLFDAPFAHPVEIKLQLQRTQISFNQVAHQMTALMVENEIARLAQGAISHAAAGKLDEARGASAQIQAIDPDNRWIAIIEDRCRAAS